MRSVILSILFLLLSSCNQQGKSADIAALNGYWEIDKVVFPGGSDKNYSVNQLVDYFEVKDTKGFRKKLQPKGDGSFLTSDDAQEFEILQDGGSYLIRYRNSMSNWEEEVVELSPEKLVLRSDAGTEYHYKRHLLNEIP